MTEALAFEVPQANDMEIAVIGAMLFDSRAIPIALDILGDGRDRIFYQKDIGIIYAAIVEMYKKGEHIDMLTLIDFLKIKNKLDDAGGYMRIASVSSSVSTGANIEYHSNIVLERANRRRLIILLHEAYQKSKDKTIDTDEVLSIVANASGDFSSSPQSFHVRDRIPHIIKNIGKREVGIQTGFDGLDEHMRSGFKAGNFIIIGARTGVGKSTFAGQLAIKMSLKNWDRFPNIAIPYFSLEMSADENISRLIAYYAGVNEEKMSSGELSNEEMERVKVYSDKLSMLNIIVDEDPSLTVDDFYFRTKRLQKDYNVGAVIIDYIQLMSGGQKFYQRHEEVSHISRSIKKYAKMLGIPVIALAQISRESEKSEDKRPQLHQLRESGSLEQDTDTVLFLYRPGMHTDIFIDGDDDAGLDDNLAEVIIAKRRGGKSGTVNMMWNNDLAIFQSMQDFRSYEARKIKRIKRK